MIELDEKTYRRLKKAYFVLGGLCGAAAAVLFMMPELGVIPSLESEEKAPPDPSSES